MPQFTPFAGVRYATADGVLDDLVAPPYDVISPDDRARLVARSPHNAVRIELPADEEGRDRYQLAAALWREWRDTGVLATEDAPAFYAYRMSFTDDAGRPRRTLGVLGALELSRPGEGGILPHERTTPKDKADRLDLLRACRANLSPIWGLSLAEGLTAAIPAGGPPDATATDEDGNRHELWVVADADAQQAIAAAVASTPVVIADGHHRYETALAYRDEDPSEAARSVLAYVVELTEDQLAVGPIHRLLSGLPAGFDLPGALAPFFDLTPIDSPPRHGLALLTPGGAWALEPTAETHAAAEADLDSSRLDVALRALPEQAQVRFQHGADLVAAAVEKGEAQAGVLLRPATVEQIAATGRGGERMPPKTTFFFPKPRTGMVFRAVEG